MSHNFSVVVVFVYSSPCSGVCYRAVWATWPTQYSLCPCVWRMNYRTPLHVVSVESNFTIDLWFGQHSWAYLPNAGKAKRVFLLRLYTVILNMLKMFIDSDVILLYTLTACTAYAYVYQNCVNIAAARAREQLL